MWIVRLALRRPYTVAVMCILMMIAGIGSALRMSVDIFPAIDIPVIGVVWSYPGLSPEEMERRVVFISERALSTSVDGIERIESQSIPGIGLLKVTLQPGTDIGAAMAQMNATFSTVLRIMPPGMTPPTMVRSNASNVQVAQLTLGGNLPEQKIFDHALYALRIKLFTIPGMSTPAPYGGKFPQVSVDVDPDKLQARGLSPQDVLQALQASNLILPAGTARIGTREVAVEMNSSPPNVAAFNQIPVKVVGNATVLLGDVAKVYDGFGDQTNIVRVDGRRATYLAIMKHADASTLAVVDATRDLLPSIKAGAPQGMDVRMDFDQSTFVRASIKGVLFEAIIASLLVSVMVLLFLGSWRSTLVVCTSIPLAIFCGIVGLKLFGHTLNLMTLGGLSLAVGMLVDDATVEVENIHRNTDMGKPLTVAILDGAAQIAVPAIVATLSICIVFFPVALLDGAARYLFTPLALAVVISMLASYLLSRTLVPLLSRMLMTGEHHDGGAHPTNPLDKFLHWFNPIRERWLDKLTAAYGRGLEAALAHRRFVMIVATGYLAISLSLLWIVGVDFFPSVDAGLMKLHVRAPAGTRIEETEKLVASVEDEIRKVIPPTELDGINSMIGVPINYNLAFLPTDNVGPMDAEITVQLKHGHRPSAEYRAALRKVLVGRFPQATTYFQPADVVTQVLNFGVSAPVDVQVEGANLGQSLAYANRLKAGLAGIPGVEDLRIKQVLDYPSYKLEVDRQRAARLGLTQRDVSNATLVALSGNGGVSPTFFLNPVNGVSYTLAVKVPLSELTSVQELMATPVATPAPLLQGEPARNLSALPQPPTQTLANLATVRPGTTPGEVDHLTLQRVVDLQASVDGSDLGSVVKGIRKEIQKIETEIAQQNAEAVAKGQRPNTTRISLRGQNEVMEHSFKSLGLGLVLAIVLVYLLMVTLYQSWLDPFIIMMAVPGALAGILWMLVVTGTTLNVESLMGAIMAVGIATSNSILLVSFANDVRVEQGLGPEEAALLAGKTRLRPVLMTALAMILGMIPMALGLGEGGSQNAPLGRAVIGGLLVATAMTLLVVPLIYSRLRRKPPTSHELEARFHEEAKGSQA